MDAKERSRIWYAKKKDEINKKRRELYHTGGKVKKQLYRAKRKEQKRLYDKAYRATHKNERKKLAQDYYHNVTKYDKTFVLKKNMRTLLYASLKRKRYVKTKHTEQAIGLTFAQFKRWIELQFEPGMTWENYGTWHIDHITPLAPTYTESEILKLFHYTNLRPLWGDDNISKLDKSLSEDELRMVLEKQQVAKLTLEKEIHDGEEETND
jgi:hypothetical protein